MDETVDAVVWRLVTLVDKRVMALNDCDILRFIIKRSNVRIVFPKRRAGSPDIRYELFREIAMQIADRGGQSDDVAGRQKIFQNQLFHVTFRKAYLEIRFCRLS